MAQVAPGQYLETTILLPDTLLGLSGPTRLAFDSATNTVYAAGRGTAVIAVDASSGRKIARIPLSADRSLVVRTLCHIPDRSELYCFREDDVVSIIDCRRNTVVDSLRLSWSGYGNNAACYNPTTGKLYYAEEDWIVVIDCTRRQVVDTIPVLQGARVVCSPRSNFVYCSTSRAPPDSLFIIDGAADTVVGVMLTTGPVSLLMYEAKKDRVYCYGQAAGGLTVLDCATNQVLATVPLPGGMSFLACADTAGKAVYVLIDDSLFVVDGGSLGVRSRLHPPRWAYAMCYHAATGRFCLASGRYTGMGETTIYDGTADTIVGRVPSGYDPYAVVGAGSFIYFGNANALSRVDPDACRLLDTLITDTWLRRVCWEPATDLVCCLSHWTSFPFTGLVDAGRCELQRWVWHQFAPKLFATPGAGRLYGMEQGDGQRWMTIIGYDVRADSALDPVRAGIGFSFWQEGLAFKQPLTRAYCLGLSNGEHLLATADLESRQHLMQARLGEADTAFGPVWNPAADKVYAAGRAGSSRLLITDGTSGLPIRTLDLPAAGPLCVDQSRNRVFCVGSTLSVVDGASDSVLAQWSLADTAVAAAACDPSLGQVYAVARNSLIVCSSPTGQPVDTVLLPTTGVAELLCDTIAGRVYCLDSVSRVVHVVDGRGGRVLTSIPVGLEPMNMAWVPPYRRVFVLNRGNSSLSVIRDTTTGVEERSTPPAVRQTARATVLRGVLTLGAEVGGPHARRRAELLDIAGRAVAELLPGRNDVRRLMPGVYYVRPASGADVRKLVVVH